LKRIGQPASENAIGENGSGENRAASWRTCTLFVGEACHIGGVKCTAQPLLLLKLEFELEFELENTARAFQQYGTRTVQGR
jgi:hypothetical protein